MFSESTDSKKYFDLTLYDLNEKDLPGLKECCNLLNEIDKDKKFLDARVTLGCGLTKLTYTAFYACINQWKNDESRVKDIVQCYHFEPSVKKDKPIKLEVINKLCNMSVFRSIDDCIKFKSVVRKAFEHVLKKTSAEVGENNATTDLDNSRLLKENKELKILLKNSNCNLLKITISLEDLLKEHEALKKNHEDVVSEYLKEINILKEVNEDVLELLTEARKARKTASSSNAAAPMHASSYTKNDLVTEEMANDVIEKLVAGEIKTVLMLIGIDGNKYEKAQNDNTVLKSILKEQYIGQLLNILQNTTVCHNKLAGDLQSQYHIE